MDYEFSKRTYLELNRYQESLPFITTLPLPTEFESNKISYKNSKLLIDKDIILSFKLNIISSKLTNTTHYKSYQQKLYRLVKYPNFVI